MTIPDKAVEAALDAWIDPHADEIARYDPDMAQRVRMRAALAAAEQAMWEPIDDETPHVEIIAVTKDTIGEAHHIDGEWRWAGNDPNDHWGDQIFPQFWRPLPPPPETKK